MSAETDPSSYDFGPLIIKSEVLKLLDDVEGAPSIPEMRRLVQPATHGLSICIDVLTSAMQTRSERLTRSGFMGSLMKAKHWEDKGGENDD